MQLRHKGDVWVIDYDRSTFPVGRIKQDTLFLDSPSRIRSTSYGIDDLVLNSTAMDYHYIIVKHGKEDWTTSRLFWKTHGKIKDLDNGRTERFLIDPLFGADKAILFEKYMDPKVQELVKQDVFDIANQSNSWDKLFPEWEAAIALEEEYKASLKYKRKVSL